MAEKQLQLRTATAADVETMIEMAAREGWNPGLADATCFRAADPEGFLVGVMNGQVVGGISAVSYDHRFGFIGLYVVAPEERGGPCGVRLARAAMARLADRTVGLDGVFERQEIYARLGFRFAYRNLRFQMEARPVGGGGEHSDAIDSVPLSAILAYDRHCFPAPREPFLRCWLAATQSHARVLQRDGRVAGYGCARRCRAGWKIGPLFADDRAGAEALLADLCAPIDAADPLYLDVPEANGPALALARDYGMREVFGTARMYIGEAPRIELSKVFGVTSFELG